VIARSRPRAVASSKSASAPAEPDALPADGEAHRGDRSRPRPRSLSLPRIAHAAIDVDFHHLDAEHLPFEANRFDTVVSTFTLCSIPDVVHALAEVRRVLKPGGQFLFLEHGRSPDARVARWQDRLNRRWMPLAGGCHLNRPVRPLIEGAGLEIGPARNYYLKRVPKFAGYLTEGVARRSA
jgi:SAM-dependent methyltransferase